MWLLVDWGTSNVRLWTVDKDQVCLQHESQNGVGQLRRRESQLNFLRDCAHHHQFSCRIKIYIRYLRRFILTLSVEILQMLSFVLILIC